MSTKQPPRHVPALVVLQFEEEERVGTSILCGLKVEESLEGGFLRTRNQKTALVAADGKALLKVLPLHFTPSLPGIRAAMR